MTESYQALIAAAFDAATLPLEDVACGHLAEFMRRLLSANQTMNLTAIVEPSEVCSKHFIDCAHLAYALPRHPENSLRVADLGTGAGFPGMVLAILRPDLHITFMDSLEKRLRFLDDSREALGLTHTASCHGRAEALGHDPAHRAQYDLVTARAVARLPQLLEYCLPLLRVGGQCWAMKGPEAGDELVEARRALATLGGTESHLVPYRLPEGDRRTLVVIDKTDPTPDAYPRTPKAIKTRPLN